jgi:hypothetical protein
MEKKVCSRCKIEKEFTEFHKRNDNYGDGYRSICKLCVSNKSKEKYQKSSDKKISSSKNYYYKNREEILNKKRKNYSPEKKKEYLENNKEKIIHGYREYREKNRQKILDYKKEYRKFNKEKIKKYRKEYIKLRTKNDLEFKIMNNLRSRLRQYIKTTNNNKKSSISEMIGCSSEELKKYLENRFDKRMSWDNYGKYGWHIDHIIPLSSVNEIEEIEKLFHFTNLQPLWWSENIKKSNKLNY